MPGGDLLLGVDVLAAMLARENELRLSPEAQFAFSEVPQDPTSARAAGLETCGDFAGDVIQPRILREFNVPEGDRERALWELRTATVNFPQLTDIPLYVKFNRAQRGLLREGDSAPDCQLRVVSSAGGARVKGHGVNETADSPLERNLHYLVPQAGAPLLVCGASWS
jgi:hypothetical protein